MAIIGQFLGYLFIEVIDDSTLKAVIGALALVTGGRYWLSVQTTGRGPAPCGHPAYPPPLSPALSHLVYIVWPVSFISLTGGIGVQIFMLPMAIHRFSLSVLWPGIS